MLILVGFVFLRLFRPSLPPRLRLRLPGLLSIVHPSSFGVRTASVVVDTSPVFPDERRVGIRTLRRRTLRSFIRVRLIVGLSFRIRSLMFVFALFVVFWACVGAQRTHSTLRLLCTAAVTGVGGTGVRSAKAASLVN